MTRRELVWTHDLLGVQNDAIGHGFFDLWTDVKVDAAELLGFELAASNPKASRLDFDRELVHRGRRYYIDDIDEGRSDGIATVKVVANALWYRLAADKFVGSLVLTDVTIAEGLEQILVGTGWTVGQTTSTSTDTFAMEQQDKFRLDLLRTWSKVTGAALVFDTFHQRVHMPDERGTDRGLAFRYRRNVAGFRRRVRPPKITRLFPFGADDLTIAGVNSGLPYIEDLTAYTAQGLTAEQAARYARSDTFVDRTFVRDTDLLRAAQEQLAIASAPEIGYEIDVVDLSEVSGVLELAEPGDIVGVFDPDFGDDVRQIVTRYRRHWLTPWRNRVELAASLDHLNDPTGTDRPQQSREWVQFPGPIRADYQIRNDGDFIVARIPLRFVESGGRADFHLDLFATGVGSGDMIVTVVDSENGSATQFQPLTVPYTDTATVRATLSWAAENLTGARTYDVLITTVADGGPSSTAGVDIAADAGIDDLDTEYEASWWIKAQGAVQESPTAANSIRFDWVTDNVQSWTSPPNVQEITIRLAGAQGGITGNGFIGGNGGIVEFTVPVVPGTPFDIYAPRDGGNGFRGWPGAGEPGLVGDQYDGAGGGGYAAIIPAGGSLVDAWGIAGAGGGAGEENGPGGGLGHEAGGAGGFLAGSPGGGGAGGGGGTQTAGGLGDVGSFSGQDGSFGQGGGGGTTPGSPPEGGGGGGGGWYGGGGGRASAAGGHGGGGGSGHINQALFFTSVFAQDGANSGNGWVEIEWEDPLF